MTTLRGGARPEAPEMPSGEVRLQQPPKVQPREGSGQALMMAVPMLGSVGAIVLVATMSTSGSGAPSATRLLLTAGMFAFATLGFVAVQIDRQRRQRQHQVTGSRTDYLHYLSQVREVVRTAARQQRAALTWHHPAPAALPALAEERSRLWERTPADPHFLHVRHGTAAQPLALDLVPPTQTPADQLDPTASSALHRLLSVHGTQPDLPTAIDLRSFNRIDVVGDEEGVRAVARSMICSATAFHSPDHLLVAVLTADRNLPEWDWLKWLPHALSERTRDAVGPRRMVTSSLTELAALLPLELVDRPRFGTDETQALPHVLLVLDGTDLPPGNHLVPTDGLHGLTVLDLRARWHEGTTPADDPTALRLDLDAPAGAADRRTAQALRPRSEPTPCTVDLLDPATAEAFARRLTPLGDRSTAEAGPSQFTDLLGLGDITTFDPAGAWRPRPARDRLRVPIGVTETGAPVHLDLKESAQQGMGPHGLVIGATGSGKSELLRTLVLGLAMTHDPTELNMVLVDFKGGATFAGMAPMPHVSAVITNLADELTLVDRMQDALSGEMVRRQELLRAAGNFASVRDYEKARLSGEPLDPLPSLLIVVDEFSEMLAEKPEFIDLFVAIGRLGRSLGLHLLLASQRLEEGRLRGLESHLSYRIGLRTFSAAESRAVLGVPDAYELPAVPGLGYLKPDQSTLLAFKAAYVSGPPASQIRVRRDEGGHLRGILPFTIAEVASLETPTEPVATPSVSDDADSVLDIAVTQMSGRGTPARRVWLPPLDRPAPLDAFFDDLVADPHLGLVSPKWRNAGALTVPLGIVDRPREQRRDVLTTSLGGAAGHVAVVGGPRTGKSTLLRTVVTSLALVTTPLESQFFVLDFGGGTFTALRDLPHLAGLGSRSEPEVVSRVVAEVQSIVDRREAFFATHGIDSIDTYRARRAAGGLDDGYGDVFVVVDGWSTLRTDFEDVELELQALAQRGLTFGVHLVASASRWVDFRASLRDLFGTRLELRLGDALDSEVDRKMAELVPARPGRGLVTGPFHFLGALPRIDGVAHAEGLGEASADLTAQVAASWPGPSGPKLRLLPESISLAELRSTSPDDPRLLLGVNERELAAVGFDPTQESHLLVLGEGQSGKSSLLRALVREITRTHTPEEAQIIAVDYRRSLLGEIPAAYQLDYLTNAAQATPAMKELADYLTNRLPGPDVTPEQLRSRSWWTGAEAWVLIDDYDLVATQAGSPLHALVPLLSQARDVGFHVVVTRRTGGAARGLYDPLLQGIRDLASPGLLLAGNPDEGPLLGNLRPQPALPGRGRLVTREAGVETIQTPWVDPQP